MIEESTLEGCSKVQATRWPMIWQSGGRFDMLNHRTEGTILVRCAPVAAAACFVLLMITSHAWATPVDRIELFHETFDGYSTPHYTVFPGLPEIKMNAAAVIISVR